MEYLKAEVMEMCHRENLYQIDLLHGSKNRVTEREYWAQRKGQAKLDKAGRSTTAALPAGEQPPKAPPSLGNVQGEVTADYPSRPVLCHQL